MLIVFGAISMELHLPVNKFPSKGIMATASDYTLNAGGKAANQAYAATRSGAKVALIGKTGVDDYSKRILDKVRREGVVTSGVGKSDTMHTGLDIICKHEVTGDIQIIKSPGANTQISAEQIPEEVLSKDNVVLVQSDIDMKENLILLKNAKAGGATTIMNLSPSINIKQEILSCLDYLIVNSTEAAKLAEKLGLPAEGNSKKIAQALAQVGKLTCIVTRGENGSVAYTADNKGYNTPALKLENFVDHHGAEDAFCGTFAACIHAKMPLSGALKRASIAASLTCENTGGQDAFPYLASINEKLEELGDVSKS
jgi:ribokinase